MVLNMYSISSRIANLFAFLVLIGVVSHMYPTGSNGSVESKPVPTSATAPNQVLPAAPKRDLRHKGSMMEEIDCIPLYPTPAPSKSKAGSKAPTDRRKLQGVDASTKGTKSPKSSSPVSHHIRS